jgi:signal transduction histidine kinase
MGTLWAATFALGACAVLGALAAAALGAGRGRPGAVVAAVAALVLLVMLIVLRHRYGTAASEQEEHEAELHHRAAELERSGYERQVQYTGTLNALGEAVDHLVRVQLPAALNGSTASQPLPDSAAGNGEAAALCARVTTAVAEGAAKLRSQLDDQIESSRLAVVTLARRVQASAHRIQEEATRMAARHPADSDVLESSMRVDHAAAQQARHAQSVAVLCGEWPGQQWPQALPLLDVVRAASSRIVAYRRVTVSGEPDTAATASVVEPLIHLIAELLANATQSSPPTTQVLVTVRTVQRGAVIEMDDGGVGMEEHQLDQARQIVSGQRLLNLGDLGEIPQTGMAVVGQYVRRHGFRVDLMPSPYGGVRAVVLVPANMVENLEQANPAAAGPAEPQPAPARAEPEPPRAEPARMEPARAEPAITAQDTGSLPQRRSRRGESGPVAPGGASPAERTLPTQTPEQAGAWMAAYFGGAGDETPGSTDPPEDSADSPVSE